MEGPIWRTQTTVPTTRAARHTSIEGRDIARSTSPVGASCPGTSRSCAWRTVKLKTIEQLPPGLVCCWVCGQCTTSVCKGDSACGCFHLGTIWRTCRSVCRPVRLFRRVCRWQGHASRGKIRHQDVRKHSAFSAGKSARAASFSSCVRF